MQKSTEHLFHLQNLIADWGRDAVERHLNVHRTTIKRWLDGSVSMPEAQRTRLALLAGSYPGTNDKWKGWKFWDGKLYDDAKNAYVPQDITGLALLRQMIDAQRREIARLEGLLRLQVSANDSHKVSNAHRASVKGVRAVAGSDTHDAEGTRQRDSARDKSRVGTC